MIMAPFASRLDHFAATLKLADFLAEGPKTAEELAALTSTHAPALYRVMRSTKRVSGLHASCRRRRW
jgi:hypothetical protein